MGWFDRKIYFYFQHSHALTLSRSSPRPRVPASYSSSAPGASLLLCLYTGWFFSWNQLGRRAIATPSPPNFTTFALIKFLPFAAIVFTHYWCPPINPNSLCLLRGSSAAWAAKLEGMNRCLCPLGRCGLKSIHNENLNRD